MTLPPLTASQQQAVELINDSPVAILSGGPGTGKTTTVCHYASRLNPYETFSCAPTGRAAIRMREGYRANRLDLNATTIHAMLQPTRCGYDGNGWEFEYNEHSPLPCRTLVSDEMSMLDNATAAWLFGALKPLPRMNRKVVLVGDPNQLPPVGPGRPFLDMIESGVIPHAHLTEVHRNAGRGAHVCAAINRGDDWQPSKAINLAHDAHPDFGPENYQHIETNQFGQTLETLIDRVKARGWNPLNDMQVLCALNDKGSVSRKDLNVRLQRLLNPDGQQVEKVPFRMGDKVICLKNGIRKGPNKGQDYVANGELGTVSAIRKDSVAVDFPGKLSGLSFGRRAWGADLALGYAITVHKSQGGEWPVVITVADDAAGRVADRSFWYVAMSRFRVLNFTIGRMSTIRRQCAERKIERRKTFLRERLEDAVRNC